MAIILDTNVVIHLRDGDPAVKTKVEALQGPLLLSIISQVELEGGVYRDLSQASVKRLRLDAILATFPVLSFDEPAAEAYRSIVEAVGYSRRKMLDRMIAAQALVHRASLATLNAADFADIPGLTVLAWS